MSTLEEDVRWYVASMRSIVALRRARPKEMAAWCGALPDYLRTEFLPLVLARNWDAVNARSETELTERSRELEQMQVYQQQLVERYRFEQTYLEVFGAGAAQRNLLRPARCRAERIHSLSAPSTHCAFASGIPVFPLYHLHAFSRG